MRNPFDHGSTGLAGRARMLLLAITALSASVSSAAAGQAPSRYLLKFNDSSLLQSGDLTAPKAVLHSFGLELKGVISEIGVIVADPLDPKVFESRQLRELRRTGMLAYIEANAIWRTQDLPADSPSLPPNDKHFRKQKEYQRIDVEGAWKKTTGSYDVVIAVTDTGINPRHPDLENQIWTNPGEIPENRVDDDANGFVDDVNGWDFAQNDRFPRDAHRHGSHVSGIIGAEGNNGTGIAGINWKVRIMPIQFLTREGSGTTEDGARAIVYAASNGARVINASWGGGPKSQVLIDSINYAYEKGAILVAASGNRGENADRFYMYPAALPLPGIISVASSIGKGSLSNFSNWGLHSVDLAAPGSHILSTVTGHGYSRLDGTSMAAPMVSGVAGLILSLRPDLTALQLRNAVLNAVEERKKYHELLATEGDLSARIAVEQLSQGFQVWPQRITVPLNGKFQFSAFDAEGDVAWSVNEPAIGTIDQQGELSGLAEGELIVTATDSSGRSASTQRVTVSGPRPVGCGGSSNADTPPDGYNPMPPGEAASAAFSLSLPFMAAIFVRRRSRRRKD